MAPTRSGASNHQGAGKSQQGGSSNGVAHGYVSKGKTTSKRGRPAVSLDIEDHFLVHSLGLSGKARLRPYVNGERSVPVLPTNRANLHEQDFPGCLDSAPISVFEEKTTYEDVVVDGKTIKVTITKESSAAQAWIDQQTGTCFGLDLEWKPNRSKGQPENKVALMQISNETECLLIQMLFLDSIPSALVRFLRDPQRKIAGVGINDDVKKLRRDFGLVCGGEVELTTLAVACLKDAQLMRAGLKILAQRVLGFRMDKSKAVTLSNWAAPHLDAEQIKYACIDAWVSHAIYKRLHESRWTQMRWAS